MFSLLVLAAMIIPTGSRAEYRLSTGDKVHVYVIGQEELDRTSAVDGSGKIWVPTIGYMQAAGFTLQELRARISGILTASEVIHAEDVDVQIVEFRPFYIDGSVTNAGSYAYSVGLTVRQAIGLAGGFDRTAVAAPDLISMVDRSQDHRSLRSQYIQHEVRVARLRAELQGQEQFNWTPPPRLLANPEIAQRISKLEEQHFEARASDLKAEKMAMDESIKLARNEVTQLKKQIKRLEDDNKLTSKTLLRLKGLQQKGVVPLSRLFTYERGAFASRIELDSTRARLAGARRLQGEVEGKRMQMEHSRRAELTRELNSAIFEMNDLRLKMTAAADALLISNATMEKMCIPKAREGIFIHRRKEGQSQRIKASKDSDVQPGDVIEVNVTNEALAAHCLSRNLPAQQLLAKEKAMH